MLYYNLNIDELVEKMLFIDQTQIIKNLGIRNFIDEIYYNIYDLYQGGERVTMREITTQFCIFDINNIRDYYLVNPQFKKIIEEGDLPYCINGDNVWLLTRNTSPFEKIRDWQHLKKYCIREWIDGFLKLQALYRGHLVRWKIPMFCRSF